MFPCINDLQPFGTKITTWPHKSDKMNEEIRYSSSYKYKVKIIRQ